MSLMWLLSHVFPVACILLGVVVLVTTVRYIRSAFFESKKSR